MQSGRQEQTGWNGLRESVRLAPLLPAFGSNGAGWRRLCLLLLCVGTGTGCLGDLATREELLERLDEYLKLSDAAQVDGMGADVGPDASDSDTNVPDVVPPDSVPGDSVDVDDGAELGTDAAADDGEVVADVPLDGGDAVDDAADVQTPDVAPDIVLTCSTTPAAAGCACKDNAKCASGICLTTADNIKQCASSCGPGLPCDAVDHVCAPVEATIGVSYSICTPKWQTLCDPCNTTTQCGHPGAAGAACVDFGPAGAYCGTPCVGDADCNQSDPLHPYSCKIVTTAEGTQDKQCVPTSPTGVGFGVCTCGALASAKELSTACFVPSYDKTTGSLIGKCKGQRWCDVGALTECSALKPSDELCDKADNDCDGLIDEGTCDDGLICTADQCAGAGECTHTTLDGNACEDGSFCTTGDICVGPVCQGKAKVCPGATCIAASCDPLSGQCDSSIKPDTAPCDDGNACTVGDICLLGNCSGAGLMCDDQNACTNDSCDPKSGCAHDPNTALCNDNNACTEADQCWLGLCTGAPKAGGCSDGNVCTDDSCDSVSGCAYLPNAVTCSDGNNCTGQDTCADGKCVPGVNECGCTQDIDCAAMEDGDLCNGTLYCNTDAIPFQCDVAVASVVKCTPPSSVCQVVACDPVSGGCFTSNVEDGLPCDADGSVCTIGDACVAGTCAVGFALICDDGNVCTDDTCDSAIGCIKSANQANCSDENACTSGDLCQGGACLSGMAATCPLLSDCLINTCAPTTGACVASDAMGPCDDGDPCTQGDTCQSGLCASGTPNPCPSSSKCATGSCDGLTGNCTFKTVPCDDGNLCTNDSCDPASGCVFAAKSCDDANACTNDSCTVATGTCTHTSKGCDDNNFCTTDSCNPATGCVYVAIAEGTVCSTNKQICVGNKCMTPFAMPTTAGPGISGGSSHTCVRTWSGGVACWGSDQEGQLGDGANKNKTLPIAVGGITAVADVACGSQFTVAVAGSPPGGKSWGAGSSGQLGNAGSTASNVPVDVSTLGTSPATLVQIAAGGAFACGIYSTGKLWCWGDNAHQQLGQGAAGAVLQKSATPVLVTMGAQAVTAVATGTAHACAVSQGKVYCWGRNGEGQCAKTGGGDLNTPTLVPGLVDIATVAAGDDFTCALGNASAGVWCWGSNKNGQLATGSLDNGTATPTAVVVNAATEIAAGLGHACVKNTTGALQCWGRNDLGQLGNGAKDDSPVAVTVPGIANTWKIGCGDTHTCVTRTDGSVWCWGNNAGGSLGLNDGGTSPILAPALVYGTSPK